MTIETTAWEHHLLVWAHEALVSPAVEDKLAVDAQALSSPMTTARWLCVPIVELSGWHAVCFLLTSVGPRMPCMRSVAPQTISWTKRAT